MVKLAVLQVADQGPLESLVVMLRAVGWECALPNSDCRDWLRRMGLDTVLSPADLTRGMGYDSPFALPSVGPDDLPRCDLYVDVKAHRNGPLLWERLPQLRSKTLWYRINGGKPEHVINDRGDHGNEADPPCPVLTPNQWYASWPDFTAPASAGGRAYCCWPPFVRFGDYLARHGRTDAQRAQPPVCLIHNLRGWGYERLSEGVRKQGVRCLGAGSPDGLVQHAEVPALLSRTLAMVHLKSNDAPGYALYEAMAAGCPIVCTRRLIWRCRMQELLIPGQTCLVFDRETHDALNDEDVKNCLDEIAYNLKQLADPAENKRIGMGGHERLRQVMWSAGRAHDVESLRAFMGNFGG